MMKLENNWMQKSLEDLEKNSYSDSTIAPTNLIKRCMELNKVPLNKFSVEDLRLMIGQEFGLSYLIPLALEYLKKDIFIEGDFFPGDLLKNVLTINITFWKENKNLWIELNDLIKERKDDLISYKIPTTSFDAAFNL
jgi:hypothetical protein